MKKLFMVLVCSLFLFISTNSIFAANKTLTFTWSQTVTNDLAGFTLYEYDSAEILTGNTFNIPYVTNMSMEHAEIITVPDNVSTSLCYDLTASDISGNESGKSNRVCVNIDFESPVDPVSLSITINVVPIP